MPTGIQDIRGHHLHRKYSHLFCVGGVVPRAFHTAAYGFAPEEFRRRILSFSAAYSSAP
jgi:hypothetical protein